MRDFDVSRVIEEMEAVPQTRERRMILALAYEVQALKNKSAKPATDSQRTMRAGKSKGEG